MTISGYEILAQPIKNEVDQMQSETAFLPLRLETLNLSGLWTEQQTLTKQKLPTEDSDKEDKNQSNQEQLQPSDFYFAMLGSVAGGLILSIFCGCCYLVVKKRQQVNYLNEINCYWPVLKREQSGDEVITS